MSKLPKTFMRFQEDYPGVAEAYGRLGDEIGAAGPLDAKTRELVKLGIAVGARQEGSARSHTRRALEAGAAVDEIRHAVLLATTTVGFANMMAGLSCVNDVLDKEGQ